MFTERKSNVFVTLVNRHCAHASC